LWLHGEAKNCSVLHKTEILLIKKYEYRSGYTVSDIFLFTVEEAERIKHALFILSKIKGTHYNYF
jgi:hypothetical protein